MMSLVDYQSSSEESENEESTVKKQPPKEPVKKREPVKITIPTVADDEDEDESSEKKCKFNSSAGLLGMLPPPKYSILKGKGGLTPYVLTKKKELSDSKNTPKKQPRVISHSYERTSENLGAVPSSNEDAESSKKCDFFSLQSSDKIEDYIPLPPEKPIMFKSLPTPISNIPSAASATMSLPSSITPQPYNYLKAESHTQAFSIDQNSVPVYTDLSTENQVAFSTIPEDVVNDERFQRLHGKHKEELNIIDVNLDQQLPSKSEWHTKALTEEKTSHSRKRHHMPTQQQKRKHHITYLAFQAKEREIDLKNQWAQNRLTKRETQAKYGF